MSERPENFDALPKRFKHYIGELEAQVSAMKKERPDKKTNVQLVDYVQRENGLYLPNSAKVRFTLTDGQLDVSANSIFSQGHQEGLQISAVGTSLTIYPEVSNVVTLVPRKR